MISEKVQNFPKIFVLGATGRLGQMLQCYWPAKDAKWQGRRHIPPYVNVCLDPLAEPVGLVQAAQGSDVILCLAGVVPCPVAEPDMRINVRLGQLAVKLGAEIGARVMLSSSAAVYGRHPGPLRESLTPTPVSDYGIAKLEMEDVCIRMAQDFGVSVTALRIGNVVGADAIVGGWKHGFRMDTYKDGTTPRRSYIGPQTLSHVVAKLTQHAELPARLNIASPEPVAMGDLLDAAGLSWTPRPATANTLAEVHLQTNLLEKYFDFDASNSRPQTLIKEWQGYKARRHHDFEQKTI